MEQSIQFYSENNLAIKELYFSFGGVSITQPGHRFGPAIRNDYLIHIILEGEGTFIVEDKKTRLSMNQGFIIKPGVSTYYEASQSKPWKYLWIAFNGERAEEFLEKAGLVDDRELFKVSNANLFFELITTCLAHQFRRLSDELMLNGLVYQFLSIITKEVVPLSNTKIQVMHPRVPEVLTFLSKNFKDPISIQDVSDALSIERSYLSRIFKKSMGISIKEFLNRLRISYAGDLINTSDKSIEEICYECGFNNHDVFIRSFKKIHKITPTVFRQINRAPIDQFEGKEDFERLLSSRPLT